MNDETLVYEGQAVPKMNVLTDGNTVWLTIDQMASLFGRDPSVIGKHIKSAFSEEELDDLINRQILPKNNGRGRPTTIYDLDVVISVGYRVKSIEGVRFRKWATRKLREILLERLASERRIDKLEAKLEKVDNRLTQVEGGFEMLIERINDDAQPFLPDDRPRIGF